MGDVTATVKSTEKADVSSNSWLLPDRLQGTCRVTWWCQDKMQSARLALSILVVAGCMQRHINRTRSGEVNTADTFTQLQSCQRSATNC